jgi:hypothetical protein
MNCAPSLGGREKGRGIQTGGSDLQAAVRLDTPFVASICYQKINRRPYIYQR